MRWRRFVALGLVVACGELRKADTSAAPAPTSSPGRSSDASPDDARPDGGPREQDASTVPPVQCTDCPVETVLKQSGTFGPIAVDGANVYVSELGKRTLRCEKTGCDAPTTLFSDGATRMALADGKLWIPSHQSLDACAAAGCGGTPTRVLTEPGLIGDIAADGTRVVWQYAAGGDVSVFRSCLFADCSADTALTIKNDVINRMMTAGNGSIVWISGSSEVLVCRNDEHCPGGRHLGSLALTGVASNADTAFWVSEASEMTKCPLAGCGEHPSILAKVSTARATVADATHVYWRSTSDNAIERCPVDDCTTPETIAVGVATSAAQNLALDDGYVYWATLEGVFRRRK